MKRAALHNLGCKVNAYETEAMQELLEENGYKIVPFGETADVYIVNTCTVTNMADRKSRQMLHRARKNNPDAIVVAAGCYVQTKGDKADSSIDIVIGNNQKKDLVKILSNYFEGKNDTGLLEIGNIREYEDMYLNRTSEHTRAYIKIQDGCNQFCSYCIIPYARGRVRSRSRSGVLSEVVSLAESGYQEVVLTGIHLSSYGMDIEDSLLSLITSVHEVRGIKRIRLGSLEPRIITEEFVRQVSALPKVCPHFHLSLQSGCDATLKRMNRRYTAEEYRKACTILRDYYEYPALTTDVIVGFPGETEEEFEESRSFIDSIDFYETHVFKYSRREGTKAAVMEDQIPEKIKTLRSNELLLMNMRKQAAYEARFVGGTSEVLMEEPVEIEGEIFQAGYTREYVKVGQKTQENLTNRFVNVEIENRLQIIR